jgi:hypothetical protein
MRGRRKEGRKERSLQIFTKGIVRVHKPGDIKKIKSRKVRTDDHKKREQKNAGAKGYLFKTYIKQYGGHNRLENVRQRTSERQVSEQWRGSL